MARCSHLHPIDPHAVTFESEACRHLVAHHVDEKGNEFFLLPTVKSLKDFSRTHLIGVAGAGLAYLQMVTDGYVWVDHFENLYLEGGQPKDEDGKSITRSPDFAFARPGRPDIAVMEAKATHGSSRKQFAGTVRRGYQKQVEPYLGKLLGGAFISHGLSIGSWMTPSTKSGLLIDCTDYVMTGQGPPLPGSNTLVKRGNYLIVLSLMYGPDILHDARVGRWPTTETTFTTTEWLGRTWIVGRSPFSPDPANLKSFLPHIDFGSVPLFGLDVQIATSFFRSLNSAGESTDFLAELPRMDEGLSEMARESGGAIYPDGFAVIGREEPKKVGIWQWNPQSGELVKFPTGETSALTPRPPTVPTLSEDQDNESAAFLEKARSSKDASSLELVKSLVHRKTENDQ